MARLAKLATRVLVALVVAAVTVELAARAMVARGALPNRIPADLFASHPIGWTLEPDTHARIFTVNGLVQIETNPFGFRDRSYARNPLPGVERLLVLGDSFTLALETQQPDTFHTRLEDRYQGAVEVIAMAASGYETQQAALAYQMIGQPLGPDTVLLMFYVGNDITGNGNEDRWHLPHYSLGERGTLTLNGYPYAGAFDLPLVSGERSTALMRHSMLVFLVENIARGLRQEQALDSGRCDYQRAENYPDPQPEDWALTEALLLALRDMVEDAGAQFRVAIIPTEFQVEQAFLRDYRARCGAPDQDTKALLQGPLRAFFDANQIAYLDLLPVLRAARARATTPLYHSGTDIHWTVEGHAAVAEALLAWLDLPDD